MLDVAVDALGVLLQPLRLAALFAGMAAGIVLGMLPGLGGVAAVSILLPFIHLMDPFAGMALLLGAIAVVYTSDTITSVMVGAPGSPASAPTAIEGHALAKQGQAARALTVGFLASAVGGVMGAVVLTVAIPVAAPLVLALGTPELFMFALVGLFYASSLVGDNAIKGLTAGCLGVALGTIGPAPAAAEFRFTFHQAYLLDGLSLVIVALGLFGIAEALSMLAQGGGIARTNVVLSGWSEGLRDFWRHRWLVLRGAVIGVFGGFVPAVGASASTWVAYAHAARSAKRDNRFGKGDIRGIAASEGANNATIISDLVPTMLFSVPGGPAAAIFLGSLFIFGYYPGPRFVTSHQDVMFVIIWSVALASVAGALICFAITPWVARLTQIRFALIAAPLLLVMVLGAYQATEHIGDIVVLVTLGLLGWMMKQGGWPRAPVLVGFVLAGPMEQYFWLANRLHGWAWLGRPGVLIIMSFIVIPLLIRLGSRWGERRRDKAARADAARAAARPAMGGGASDTPEPAPLRKEEFDGALVSTLLGVAVLALFVFGLRTALGFFPDARLLPLLAIVPGVAFAALALASDARMQRSLWRGRALYATAPGTSVVRAELVQFVLLAGYVAGIWIVGFLPATAVYLLWILLNRARMSPIWAVVYGGIILLTATQLAALMRLSPPAGLVATLF